jgi:hypothetical protein
LSFNSSSAVALTLPATPPTAIWKISVQNVGTGSLTVNRNGLNIDGAATNLTLAQGSGVVIFTDGTNYFTERGAVDTSTLATKAAIQQESYISGTDTGTANAYAVTLSPAPIIGVYSIVVLKIAHANTGSSTLSVNGATAPIKKNGASDLAPGDLPAGSIAIFINDGTNWQLAPNGSLPAGTNQPAIRGAGMQASSGSSFVVNWPTGTVAGDLAIIQMASGFTPITPSGWTVLDGPTGGTWNGQTISKVLTSGDISTGSVTVTFSSAFDSTVSITTFIGPTGGVRELDQQHGSGGSFSQIVSTSSAVAATDTLIYLGSVRGTGANTLSRGTFKTSADDGVSGSGFIYAESPSSTGAITATFNYPGGTGAGAYSAIVVLQGVPLAPVVTSLNSLTGALTITGDSSITVTPSGSSIALHATSGGGSVTSVGLTVPSRQAVTGSPVTAAGTLAITDNTQSANLVFAGPSSGSAAAPTFRALVAADIPGGGGSTVFYGSGDAVASTGQNQITLGSTPITGSVKPFINGLRKASGAYTLSGAVITLVSAFTSGDIALVDWVTLNSTPGGITLGSSTPVNPTIRGTGIQASVASSYTVSWPTGTLAGDLAVICYGGGCNVGTTPTGWTVNQTTGNTSGFGGTVLSKTLTSGDITAGSVAVPTLCNFDGTIAIVTFVGGTAGIREVDFSLPGAVSSQNVSTSSAALNSDTAIYFGSNRGASTDTVNRGTLQRQANNGGAASGCLYTEAIAASGVVTATFSYSSAGSGSYQAIVVVKGV